MNKSKMIQKISRWGSASLMGIFTLFIALAFYCGKKSDQTRQAEPIVTEVNIPVQGMTCGSCEHHIETEVKRKDGIVEIKADHEKAVACVKYDSTKISLDELVAAINETGYTASKPN